MNSYRLTYNTVFTFLCFLMFYPPRVAAQNIDFSGQAIGWSTLHPETPFQLQGGLRYIPEISFTYPLGDYSLDGEFSVNLWGSATVQSDEEIMTDRELSPYRMWLRFSGNRFDVRAGLQKINFGSAVLLRPLMWFDRMDPRDPLQLTDGVYGVLGRYYFLNNANLWLWGLYGNNGTKGWEYFPSKKNSIEYGGRFQFPVEMGEMALSYHHRRGDTQGMPPDTNNNEHVFPENRIALDTRLDLVVGLWMEASLMHQDLDFTGNEFTTMLNMGSDYTFNLGNGLHAMGEGFAYMKGKHLLGAQTEHYYGLLSLSYPISIIHELSTMVFYDFTEQNLYRFVNWSMTYDRWGFYIIGFWNPESYALYNFETEYRLYAGWGFQLMAVFNH